MPRKKDLERVDVVADEFGIDRVEFGDYIHDCKDHGDRGSGPRGDFTLAELREKASEYKELYG